MRQISLKKKNKTLLSKWVGPTTSGWGYVFKNVTFHLDRTVYQYWISVTSLIIVGLGATLYLIACTCTMPTSQLCDILGHTPMRTIYKCTQYIWPCSQASPVFCLFVCLFVFKILNANRRTKTGHNSCYEEQ